MNSDNFYNLSKKMNLVEKFTNKENKIVDNKESLVKSLIIKEKDLINEITSENKNIENDFENSNELENSSQLFNNKLDYTKKIIREYINKYPENEISKSLIYLMEFYQNYINDIKSTLLTSEEDNNVLENLLNKIKYENGVWIKEANDIREKYITDMSNKKKEIVIYENEINSLKNINIDLNENNNILKSKIENYEYLLNNKNPNVENEILNKLNDAKHKFEILVDQNKIQNKLNLDISELKKNIIEKDEKIKILKNKNNKLKNDLEINEKKILDIKDLNLIIIELKGENQTLKEQNTKLYELIDKMYEKKKEQLSWDNFNIKSNLDNNNNIKYNTQNNFNKEISDDYNKYKTNTNFDINDKYQTNNFIKKETDDTKIETKNNYNSTSNNLNINEGNNGYNNIKNNEKLNNFDRKNKNIMSFPAYSDIENNKENIENLQKLLYENQNEKNLLESELRRYPFNPKRMKEKEKVFELENKIENISKNISNLKKKLKYFKII